MIQWPNELEQFCRKREWKSLGTHETFTSGSKSNRSTVKHGGRVYEPEKPTGTSFLSSIEIELACWANRREGHAEIG